MDTSKVAGYIDKGYHDRHWYADTQRLFEYLYGAERLPLITQLFAATSINSSLKSNIRLFRRALNEIDKGEPRGGYLPVMAQQIDHIRNGRPLSGRKINSFARAMSGDTEAVVVDVWLKRAFDEDQKYIRIRNGNALERSSGASDWQYNVIEAYVRNEASRRGLEPREVSAMIWSGIRGGVTRYDQYLLMQEYNMFTHGTI